MYSARTNAHTRFVDKPPRWWLNRIFIHQGTFEEFIDRYRHAVRHVEHGQLRRPLLADALFDVITDHRNFLYAFHDSNTKSAPGPDRVTWKMMRPGLDERVRVMSDQVRNAEFQRRSERVIRIPKPHGGFRFLVLQSILDRLIDKACALILSIALDSGFSRNSFAFRPRRSCWNALNRVRSLMRNGHRAWVSCDIRDAYCRVSIDRLVEAFHKRLPDECLSIFIKRRISGCPTGGLRQGSPLSPLMLNLYLDHFLDRHWAKNHRLTQLIRYVDDIAIACHTVAEARESYSALIQQLHPQGMAVKECADTAVINLRKQSLPYLGFKISLSNGRTSVQIGDKGFYRLKLNLTETSILEEDLQACLAGWLEYFAPAYRWEDRDRVFGTVTSVFADLDRKAEMPEKRHFLKFWKNAYGQYHEKTAV